MSADIEPKLKDILQDRVKTWPVEDQKKLAYAAFNIEAERQSIDPAAMGQFARTLTNAVAKQELDEPTKYWEKAKNDYFSECGQLGAWVRCMSDNRSGRPTCLDTSSS